MLFVTRSYMTGFYGITIPGKLLYTNWPIINHRVLWVRSIFRWLQLIMSVPHNQYWPWLSPGVAVALPFPCKLDFRSLVTFKLTPCRRLLCYPLVLSISFLWRCWITGVVSACNSGVVRNSAETQISGSHGGRYEDACAIVLMMEAGNSAETLVLSWQATRASAEDSHRLLGAPLEPAACSLSVGRHEGKVWGSVWPWPALGMLLSSVLVVVMS
jgi:hypothetical protein